MEDQPSSSGTPEWKRKAPSELLSDAEKRRRGLPVYSEKLFDTNQEWYEDSMEGLKEAAEKAPIFVPARKILEREKAYQKLEEERRYHNKNAYRFWDKARIGHCGLNIYQKWYKAVFMKPWNLYCHPDFVFPDLPRISELQRHMTDYTPVWEWKERKKTTWTEYTVYHLVLLKYENNKPGNPVIKYTDDEWHGDDIARDILDEHVKVMRNLEDIGATAIYCQDRYGYTKGKGRKGSIMKAQSDYNKAEIAAEPHKADYFRFMRGTL